MGRSDKAAWLEGPGDLKEADVEDVPVAGQSVRVRGLSAKLSHQANSEALTATTGQRGDQITTVDSARLVVLKFANGVIEPQFTIKEAEQVAEKYGPAFNKVVEKIDELSEVGPDAVKETAARFPSGGASPNGADVGSSTSTGSGGSAVHARAGAGAGDAGGGDV